MCEKRAVRPIVLGNYYNAYSIIRSFADKGIKSVLVTSEPKSFVAKSKYLHDMLVIPGMTSKEGFFIEKLVHYGEKVYPERGMLFPTHDEQVLYIAKHKEELKKYYEIPFSDYEILLQIMDKKNFTEKCRAIGVPTIKEKLISSFSEVEQIKAEFRFPVIVKIDIWNNDIIKVLDGKIAIFYDENEFNEKMKLFFETLQGESLLVQEYIEDSDRLMPNVNSIADKEGELKCIFVSEKVRQYPPQTGTSTATISVDPEESKYSSIIEYSKKIIKSFGFYGLFGIEFKYDKVDDCYKVIEMNCRSEFPNYLQVLVGQNMPYYLYNYHMGVDTQIPYFPTKKKALCYVPFLDKYYSTKVNVYKNKTFLLSNEEWKSSIFKPYTLYGVSKNDLSAYIKAYIESIKKGLVEKYRIKHDIPNTMSMKQYFMNKMRKEK